MTSWGGGEGREEEGERRETERQSNCINTLINMKMMTTAAMMGDSRQQQQ